MGIENKKACDLNYNIEFDSKGINKLILKDTLSIVKRQINYVCKIIKIVKM